MKTLYTITAAILLTVLLPGSMAWAVSAEEAAKLKSELMPLGGERAGNKDGTIPAWDGGYTKVPAGYKSGQPRPDPFAAEKPLFTITAANMAQYKAKLDEGQQYLLKRYPEYKLNVYPTHRTAAAPQWVYDETYKNATRAKMIGDGVSGAYGGIPFPIPKTGNELMWNHLLRVRAGSMQMPFNSYIIDPSGTISLGSSATNEMSFPYYQKGLAPDKLNNTFDMSLQYVTAPPVRAGELLMWQDYLDETRAAWQYLVGQRRTRRAPMICCDTPNFVNSGVDFFDQPFIWYGPFDRYDWKIIGKREMYIPYNSNRLVMAHDNAAIGKHFVNPELVRWELHRVWEVEGTLRAGQRDVRPRRKMYFDEDTYIAAIGNSWDAQGTMWHTSYGFSFIEFELPTVAMEVWTTMDLIRGSYTYSPIGDQAVQLKLMDTPETYWPTSNFSPDALSRRGVR